MATMLARWGKFRVERSTGRRGIFALVGGIAWGLLALLSSRTSGNPQTSTPEPIYVFSQTGGSTMTLSLRVASRPEGTSIRIFDAATPGTTPTHTLDALLELDSAGFPRYGRTRYTPKDKPYQVLATEATVPPASSASSAAPASYQVSPPPMEGVLPYSGTLVSSVGLQLFIGRLYDARKGGEQRFVYLVDDGVRTPLLCPLTLTADGSEEITFGEQTVKARRLKYRASLPFLARDQTTGVFYVGAAGELLRCDTPFFFKRPYQVAAPALVNAREGTVMVRVVITAGLEKPIPFTLKGKRTARGMEATFVTGQSLLWSTTWLDDRFSTREIRNRFLGRDALFRTDGVTLRYRVERGTAETASCSSGRPFFFAHWFATDLWETNPRYFGGMAPVESPGLLATASNPTAAQQKADTSPTDLPQTVRRDSEYVPLYTGYPGAYWFSVERLPDRSVPQSGRDVTVHRYRFTIWSDAERTKAVNEYDVYTDGRRLIVARGARDGV